MDETIQNMANIASLVLAVLAVGTVLVWGMGRVGRLVEPPARRLGRYLFSDDENDGDGNG